VGKRVSSEAGKFKDGTREGKGGNHGGTEGIEKDCFDKKSITQ